MVIKVKSSDYIAPRLGGAAAKVSMHVRGSIYSKMIGDLAVGKETRILDVGVTCDRTEDSNFLEKLHPYPHNITAVGLEDASFLERDYPGLTFVQGDATSLPFDDQSFDVAFCSAVIEHVGARANQEKLLRELVRVARVAVVTTPNRFFPLEFHTLTPLIHWLPARIFSRYLRMTGRHFFASEANLNLLDSRSMRALFRKVGCRYRSRHHRLLFMKSNLVYYLEA